MVRAATATAEFVRHHAAAIASFAASTAVFMGCEAVTDGIGSVGCGAIAGAVGNAVSYGITAAESGHFSWSGLGKSVAEGAIAGAAGGGFGALAGELGSGAADAASALADSASGEAGGEAAEAAGDLADSAGGDGGAGSDDGPVGDDTGGGAEEHSPAGGDGDPAQASNNNADAPGDGDGPTCGGSSFTAGTKVLLASGVVAAISSLKVGDKVLATSTKTGKTSPETVAAVLVHHDTDLYDLRVKVGGRTEVIDTTASHLFWVPYLDKGWIPADHLKPGMHLKTPDGQPALVVGGSVPAVHDGWMWDLTVPGNNDHDFYVLPAGNGTHGYYHVDENDVTAVLVHNINAGECDPEGLTPYGRGELPRAAAMRRFTPGQDPVYPGQNVAAARLSGGRILVGVSNPVTGVHAEEDILSQMAEGDSVDALYSEREPCGPSQNNCAGELATLFPDAQISWSVPYSDSADPAIASTINAAAKRTLIGMINSFGRANGF